MDNYWPPKKDEDRLERYIHYDQLQEGNHFGAWNVKLENQLNERWGKLRYIAANFAGLISKVIADMLFGEAAKFKVQSDDGQQFLDALIFENNLHTQNYESALANSARGDAIFKIRKGFRNQADKDAGKESCIIEDISPYVFFPTLDMGNMRGEPSDITLGWCVHFGDKMYLRKEIHTGGFILNELWEYDMESKMVKGQVNWNDFYPDVDEITDTKIKNSLIVHVPNWRKGTQYFGMSDYMDLESLFFALNNRITKIDNVLDKHTDPILAVPEGVLDEDGNVKKQNIGLFEVPSEGQANKPEYIVWNANLDSAFQQIDKIVEMLFMFSEISPDALGMGKGQSDSGRALKLKLLRTIAKKNRKALYYDHALKKLLTTAQEFSQVWGLTAVKDGDQFKAPKKIETPEIEFADGIVTDTYEAAQEEQIRLNSGTTSKKDAIMRLDGIDAKAAEVKVKEIDEESGMDLPLTSFDPNPSNPIANSEQDNNE